jgi:hypothetical protein
LQDNSQCDVMNEEMVSLLYLGDQFTSAAVRLQDIRYHFISAGFELFNWASIVTLPTNIGSSLDPPIITGRTLGIASERR